MSLPPANRFDFMQAVGIAGGVTGSVVILAIFLAWLATPTPIPEPACPDLGEIREEILDRASEVCNIGWSWKYRELCCEFRAEDIDVLKVKYADAMECHRECPTLTSCQSRDSS